MPLDRDRLFRLRGSLGFRPIGAPDGTYVLPGVAVGYSYLHVRGMREGMHPLW